MKAAAVLLGLLVGGLARADQSFLSEQDMPVALFGGGARGDRASIQLTDAELSELSHAVGKRVSQKTYSYLVIHGPKAGAPPLGAIFLLDVVGQSLPISFAVGVKADGTLQDIQVSVYREPYGSEINDRRFRAQFRGKSAQDPLVVGKDIDAISGATISSGSATYAAHKALALWPILQRRPATPP